MPPEVTISSKTALAIFPLILPSSIIPTNSANASGATGQARMRRLSSRRRSRTRRKMSPITQLLMAFGLPCLATAASK